MKNSFSILSIGILIAGALAGQSSTKGGTACDRACLENFVDQYMDALIAHDPKKLPMTARVKNTEDGVRLDPGDGFWRTALAKGSYRLFVTDPEAGQVAFIGTMREVNAPMPNPVIIAIRLKIENRQVSEIENLVVRDAQAANEPGKVGQAQFRVSRSDSRGSKGVASRTGAGRQPIFVGAGEERRKVSASLRGRL